MEAHERGQNPQSASLHHVRTTSAASPITQYLCQQHAKTPIFHREQAHQQPNRTSLVEAHDKDMLRAEAREYNQEHPHRVEAFRFFFFLKKKKEINNNFFQPFLACSAFSQSS
jgi:hypothetical protein